LQARRQSRRTARSLGAETAEGERQNLMTSDMKISQTTNLAKDLTKTFPRSPREIIAGYVIAARTLDKCRATLAGIGGEYHFDCRLDNFFFGFAEISAEEFKDFVGTGASDGEVAKWIEEKAKKRPRIEIIRWNNDWRYKRISEMPEEIQEFMEDYIPQFVPADLRHHIDYFFDIYDAEENRIA